MKREIRWIVKNYPKFRCKHAMLRVFNEKFNQNLTRAGLSDRYRRNVPLDKTMSRYIRTKKALPPVENAHSFKAPSALYPAFPYVAKIEVPRIEDSLHILECAVLRGEIRMISKTDYLKAEAKYAKYAKQA